MDLKKESSLLHMDYNESEIIANDLIDVEARGSLE